MMMSHRAHRTTDRTTNLLISSNVHFVYFGGDNKRKNKQLESSDSPQVLLPRQCYSPGCVTIFALLAVPLCPL